MAYRNFVKEANMIALQRVVKDKEKLKQAYENCSMRFWSYCGIAHFMAHEEYYKVYDYYDEHHLIQGFAKRVFKECDKEFQRYDDYLNKNMEENAKFLLNDFHNNIYKGLQKPLLDLTLTFKFYYERAGLTDLDMKAQITTTNVIISMAADLWHDYFDIYKSQFVIDFSKDYQWAKLDDSAHFFSQLADDVCKCTKNNLHPTKNYASVQAFNALCEKMVDDKFVDDNGYRALKLNHYDKEVNEIEQSRMGIDKLKAKFNSK